MQGSVYIAAAILSAAVVLIMILIVFIWRFCYYRRVNRINDTTKPMVESFQSDVAKLPMADESKDQESFSGFHHPQDIQSKGSFSMFRHGVLPNTSFNWSDHPWLVSEAVEYGWSRFAFTADQGRETAVETSWEVCAESVDFMQKIRFNPELKKIDMGIPPLDPPCVFIKSSLPLPGPPFENSSFPQEAFFEITIVSCPNDEDDSVHSVKISPGSGELAKLIPQTSNASVLSDSLIHVTENNDSGRVQELKLRIMEGEEQKEAATFTVGLSVGGSLPRELPGSYPGSIGFNSNGSLFLDGLKLVSGAEETEWERKDKVIGCGFNPSQKKVFFTVDSQLVHVINCKTEDFGFPLYPTLATNVDITVLVNFGQSAFKYLPANAQRTPNPCFIAPIGKGSAAGYEDSRELFSMAIADSQWLNPYTLKSNGDSMSPERSRGETELFEIAFSGPVDHQAKR